MYLPKSSSLIWVTVPIPHSVILVRSGEIRRAGHQPSKLGQRTESNRESCCFLPTIIRLNELINRILLVVSAFYLTRKQEKYLESEMFHCHQGGIHLSNIRSGELHFLSLFSYSQALNLEETGRVLRQRVREHLRYIKDLPSFLVAEHFDINHPWNYALQRKYAPKATFNAILARTSGLLKGREEGRRKA